MVSAKMRLGYMDDSRTLDVARAIHAAGAQEIVVHARTKADGYKPPAYWERIAAVRQAVPITLIANGEIWTVEHAELARERSGCEHLMLGRGMVADPGLALRIAGQRVAQLPWAELLPLMQVFFDQVRATVAPKHQGGRLKQWLHYLKRAYPEAEAAYAELRTVNAADELAVRLFR
jgi:tRNA-dihydrouridine synthase C